MDKDPLCVYVWSVIIIYMSIAFILLTYGLLIFCPILWRYL